MRTRDPGNHRHERAAAPGAQHLGLPGTPGTGGTGLRDARHPGIPVGGVHPAHPGSLSITTAVGAPVQVIGIVEQPTPGGGCQRIPESRATCTLRKLHHLELLQGRLMGQRHQASRAMEPEGACPDCNRVDPPRGPPGCAHTRKDRWGQADRTATLTPGHMITGDPARHRGAGTGAVASRRRKATPKTSPAGDEGGALLVPGAAPPDVN